jgi:hypothetical protein
MPVIPALRRLKKEDLEFEARMIYIARPCAKKRVILQDMCTECSTLGSCYMDEVG